MAANESWPEDYGLEECKTQPVLPSRKTFVVCKGYNLKVPDIPGDVDRKVLFFGSRR